MFCLQKNDDKVPDGFKVNRQIVSVHQTHCLLEMLRCCFQAFHKKNSHFATKGLGRTFSQKCSHRNYFNNGRLTPKKGTHKKWHLASSAGVWEGETMVRVGWGMPGRGAWTGLGLISGKSEQQKTWLEPRYSCNCSHDTSFGIIYNKRQGSSRAKPKFFCSVIFLVARVRC